MARSGMAVESHHITASAVAWCDDLASFASYRDLLLGLAREALIRPTAWNAKHVFIN
jgi:hypothetical protein